MNNPSTPTTLVVAAAIVDDIRRPRYMLAAQRAYPQDLRGRWEFPGGKVEATDADYVAALRREIREEMGCELHIFDEVPGPERKAWPVLRGLEMRVWLAELTGNSAMNRSLVAPVEVSENRSAAETSSRIKATREAANTAPSNYGQGDCVAAKGLPTLPKPGPSHLRFTWVLLDNPLSVDWLEPDVPIALAVSASLTTR